MTVFIVEYTDNDGRVEQIDAHRHETIDDVYLFAYALIDELASETIRAFLHNPEIVPHSKKLCYMVDRDARARGFNANKRSDIMHLVGPVVRIVQAKEDVKIHKKHLKHWPKYEPEDIPVPSNMRPLSVRSIEDEHIALDYRETGRLG